MSRAIDGVVGSAEVGNAYQGGDAQFGTPLALDVAGEAGDDEVDATVVAYQFEHATCQQCDDDEFAHAGDARAHGSEPVEERHTRQEANEAGRHDAQHQDQHDVDARYGSAQYDQVGEDLEPLDALSLGWCADVQSLEDVDAQHNQGRRYDDEARSPVFVSRRWWCRR